MPVLSFRQRAIAHLRDRLHVHTTVMPESRIEDEHGNARFEGSLLRAHTSSTLNLASLYAVTAAAVVALVGERPMGEAAHAALRSGALALAIASVVLFAAAQWARHRNTIRLWIELRGQAVVEVGDVEAVRNASGDRSAWILAAQGFTKEALATAERLQVRCFAAGDHAIAECVSVEHSAGKAA
jgi:hypothetical protein